jgi:arylsulfatase A-like enzyme
MVRSARAAQTSSLGLLLLACTAAPQAGAGEQSKQAAASPAAVTAAAAPTPERGPCGHGGRLAPRAPEPPTALRSIHVSGRARHLLDLPRRVTGSAEAARPLQTFDAAQLATWRRPAPPGAASGALLFRSPALDAGLSQSTEVRIKLRPGGATAATVVPISAGGGVGRDRAFRTVSFPLEPDPDNATVTLSLDVRELLQRSWDSLATRGALQLIEITLEQADPARTGLEELVFLDALAPYTEPAGVQHVEVDGALRPSLYLHAGASARLEVELDAAADSLRLHVAGTDPRSRLRLQLEFDGNTTTLFDAELTQQWQRTSISIAEWRGHKVAITASNPGGGVSFAGQPELANADSERPPDLILYLVDTLVASRLGAWGSPLAAEGISPTIDRIADQGYSFGSAMSPAPWTKPVVASLLSGLDPTVHGVGSHNFTEQLPARVPLLQERFAAAGYRTGSFSANPLGSTLSGLQRGFDLTLLPRRFRGNLGPLNHPSAAQLQGALLDWVAEQPERPFMAYLHTLEVHEYKNPVFDWPRPGWTRYDHAIRAQDGALAALLQALEQRGRDTVLVFLSDHGESFGDHGLFDHGTGLYQSQLHVPLIFFAPRYLPRASDNRLVSTLDLAPSLLELFGLPALPLASGSSLFAARDAARDARPVYASREWYVWDQGTPEIFAALSPTGAKAMRGGGREDALYDLPKDPCEAQPAPWSDSPLERALQVWIDGRATRRNAFEQQYGKVAKGVVQARDMAKLRALGYVH